MKKNLLVLFSALGLVSLGARGFILEWDKIEHWTGEGENRAALVVQFLDNGPEEAYVWGYRWPSGTEASGEDMFRAIAAASDDLSLFTQFTGPMGNTVCGIGYSLGHTVSDYLEFDFDGAMEDPNISFNWFSANTFLGQSSTPGWDTPDLCQEAIEASKESHILDHPINARQYGYACYDYDWWQPYDLPENELIRWNAGWYKGYWSYWCGGTDSDYFAYSGLGMTSRKLRDGDVDGWKYALLDGPVVFVPGAKRESVQNRSKRKIHQRIDATTGATAAWYPLNYSHFNTTGLHEIASSDNNEIRVYRADGKVVGNISGSEEIADLSKYLPAGLYIISDGNKSRKVMITR
ncbi:MAG: T9SS type A sorting domain-containing protein [Bacteroides sp.]|nr:T9SS type A sorting domain-containing protein [Bacteroides sp.]MBD5306202.1 T9SS type A sorting domain-containing protein [Bacteroides sp.]